jgi:hypothetical protein
LLIWHFIQISEKEEEEMLAFMQIKKTIEKKESGIPD